MSYQCLQRYTSIKISKATHMIKSFNKGSSDSSHDSQIGTDKEEQKRDSLGYDTSIFNWGKMTRRKKRHQLLNT